ncbi:MAG: arginine--tRNA ligase [Saprospiraceae bacterium]|nr:arginine--tRNA ligase [Saprospiraceae bacterium]
MRILIQLLTAFQAGMKEVYQLETSSEEVLINPTKKEFTGDFTIVLFSFTKKTGEGPETMGEKLGNYLVINFTDVIGYNVIKGFLNLEMSHTFWTKSLSTIKNTSNYGFLKSTGEKYLIEYASPNTNKPLHLGHIRNILLGWSVSRILEANGHQVIRTQVVNDRGIAICKSMLAWLKFGKGETPATLGKKGDHFVGDFYVLFENKFQEEYKVWQESELAKMLLAEKNIQENNIPEFFKDFKNTYFNDYSELGKEAREMLQKWEKGDAETISLWNKMNDWVYEGFGATYDKLKVSFDKNYYESQTYLLGKETVELGLKKGVFEKEADGSVWIDLTDAGMDRKIVLRSDGTSVYITQDIGTAMIRYKDFGVSRMIYTVADEQDYHFKVLFEMLKRLGEPYAGGLYHLNYGMVDLTTGKMKSREGTVVDADDLIQEVISEASAGSAERGELAELTVSQQQDIFDKIGFAALKFFILKVQPRKRMTFNPQESLDMQGQTGPYIQNAFVRIQSIFRKSDGKLSETEGGPNKIEQPEKELLRLLISFPDVVAEAGRQYDPSTIANYCYALAKDFHRFYHEVRILGAETAEEKNFRLQLCACTGDVLERAMDLLGIDMPDRM